MQLFELVIKNERVRKYQVFLNVFLAFNIILFTALATASSQQSIVFRLAGAAVVIFLLMILNIGFKKKQARFKRELFAMAIVLAVYVSLSNWWAAAGVLLTVLLYIIASRQMIILVSKEEVSYPSFPKKKTGWADINNILIKDGLLTIDFKNNTLVQHPVINGPNDYDVDEQEFNEFCHRQLTNQKD